MNRCIYSRKLNKFERQIFFGKFGCTGNWTEKMIRISDSRDTQYGFIMVIVVSIWFSSLIYYYDFIRIIEFASKKINITAHWIWIVCVLPKSVYNTCPSKARENLPWFAKRAWVYTTNFFAYCSARYFCIVGQCWPYIKLI